LEIKQYLLWIKTDNRIGIQSAEMEKNDMKMKTIIDKVSDMYRAERKEVGILQNELNAIDTTLREVDKTYGEHITLREYNRLVSRKNELMKEIKLKEQHYEGISCVRELLMDLGFDTKVTE
jgi:hypothetical protein